MSANPYIEGPPAEDCSCNRELDGADGFTFEEFGVGSNTDSF